MAWKNFVLGTVLVLFSALGAGQAAGTQGQCTQLFSTVCNGCHNTDRVCDSMGGSEEKWQAILDWMISNGAELDKLASKHIPATIDRLLKRLGWRLDDVDLVISHQYTESTISPLDVSVMMTLLKIARLKSNPDNIDNWIDACGYMACGGELIAKVRK